MTNRQFYTLINLPFEVINQLNDYEAFRKTDISAEMKSKILCRQTWDEGIKELELQLAPDPDGMKILWELINITVSYTSEEYNKLGISDEILCQTFGFIPRFMETARSFEGKYRFTKAWWLPREISLQEFRIGTLEYEFVESSKKEIEIHIPSDANLNLNSLTESIHEFNEFRQKYFPEWMEAPLTTETWLLMPELENFLSPESKILIFKHLFDVVNVDYEQTWYLEFLFPGAERIDADLPEKTSLQKKLKAHLLSGKKFGVARGYLKAEFNL